MCAGEISVKHCVNMKGEGENELLVMSQNRKDPSNQNIPSAPDIPRCSLRFREKCSTVMLAKGTLAQRWAALSQHLLPSESDPASIHHCHHEDRKVPSWHQRMSSVGEEGNIQTLGSRSGIDQWKNLPKAKPEILACHSRFFSPLSCRQGWKGEELLPTLFRMRSLRAEQVKAKNKCPFCLASACKLQYNGVFLILGCTSWNPGQVDQCHCHSFPCHSPNTDPQERSHHGTLPWILSSCCPHAAQWAHSVMSHSGEKFVPYHSAGTRHGGAVRSRTGLIHHHLSFCSFDC